MAELIVLRLVHVLGGIFWIGTMLYNTFFLVPAFAGAGPQASAAVSKGLRERGIFTVLPVVAVLTILTGIRLMQITSSGFSAAWFESRPGMTYAIGGLAAIVGFLVGMLFARPTMMRMAAVMGERAAANADKHAALDATIAGLRTRGATANAVVAALLIASAITMAVARYL